MSKAGYTSHGHEISGAAVYPPERPKVYRCGGPGLCEVCSRESAAWQAEQDRLDESEIAKVAAQRAVAIAELEVKLAKVRAYVDEGLDGMPPDPYDEAQGTLRVIRRLLDGGSDDE